jgi:hypothetical protein
MSSFLILSHFPLFDNRYTLCYSALMPLYPELIMAADGPEASTRRKSAAQLVEEPWFEAYWPVPYLPANMGMIAEAEQIPGDPYGCYYAPVQLGFFANYLDVGGRWEAADDTETDVELTYEELACLIDAPSLCLYREATLPTGSTRRIAGFLRLRPAAAEEPAQNVAPDPSDLPF